MIVVLLFFSSQPYPMNGFHILCKLSPFFVFIDQGLMDCEYLGGRCLWWSRDDKMKQSYYLLNFDSEAFIKLLQLSRASIVIKLFL